MRAHNPARTRRTITSHWKNLVELDPEIAKGRAAPYLTAEAMNMPVRMKAYAAMTWPGFERMRTSHANTEAAEDEMIKKRAEGSSGRWRSERTTMIPKKMKKMIHKSAPNTPCSTRSVGNKPKP